MQLPFSRPEFLEIFAAYNSALWPAAAALWLASLVALLALIAGRASSRVLALLLVTHWAWSAIAYHALYFSRINPAARIFAGGFLMQAALVLWFGVVRSRLRFAWGRTPRHVAAGVLGAYALVYPLLSVALGHPYPATATFGVPCPTTLFTVALLLAADAPLPASIVVVPVLWAVIGGSAAFLLGITPDLMLFAAGALLAVYAIRPRVRRRLPM